MIVGMEIRSRKSVKVVDFFSINILSNAALLYSEFIRTSLLTLLLEFAVPPNGRQCLRRKASCPGILLALQLIVEALFHMNTVLFLIYLVGRIIQVFIHPITLQIQIPKIRTSLMLNTYGLVHCTSSRTQILLAREHVDLKG
jgi:hypothetical protein